MRPMRLPPCTPTGWAAPARAAVAAHSLLLCLSGVREPDQSLRRPITMRRRVEAEVRGGCGGAGQSAYFHDYELLLPLRSP